MELQFDAAFVRSDIIILLFTSPAKAVAKYRDEYVCVSVCLSVRQDISGTTR